MTLVWMDRIKKIFFKPFFLYFIAIIFTIGIVDSHKAHLHRLTNILYRGWGDYPVLFSQNKASFDQKRFRRAIHYYKIVLEVMPDNDRVYEVIGYCYYFLKEYDRALKYYKKAFVLRPDRGWYGHALGIIYFKQQKYDQARASFRQVFFLDAQISRNAAILSLLKTMPLEKKKVFVERAFKFSNDIRALSLKMIYKIYMIEKNYEKAFDVANYVTKNFPELDKKSFILMSQAALFQQKEGPLKDDTKELDAFLSRPSLFPERMYDPMLHPWSPFIKVGTENYFNMQ